MTEAEYLRATNRVKISMAKNIVKDIVPGAEYGITDGAVNAIIGTLSHHEAELFSSYSLADEYNSPITTDAENRADFYESLYLHKDPKSVPCKVNVPKQIKREDETIGPGVYDCRYLAIGAIKMRGNDGRHYTIGAHQYTVLEWRKNEADNG
jgi:hypothetical protein